MKIGFFDSGIGGLSVLHLARRLLPDRDFLYYADEDHVPYGSRTPEEILGYTREAVRFMRDRGAGAVVIACNTATSAAAETLRREFDIPIVGMEPAVKAGLAVRDGKRVLAAATPVTLAGEKMRTLLRTLDTDGAVDTVSLGGLVPFAEREEFQSPAVEDYLRTALAPFDLERYGVLVLGCTHFNFFKDTLRRLLPPSVRLLDGNEGTVRQLRRKLEACGTPGGGCGAEQFFFSGRPVTEREELERLGRYLEVLDRMLEIA